MLAANPRTVVVVNSGAPVLLPWADAAAAVLLTWFGGQEYGTALGDILSGRAEPGGRLPTTWPDAEADVPVLDVTPRDGVVRYDEGIHIGYRAWLRSGARPRYWFGAGEGYTAFETGAIEAEALDASLGGGARVRVPVQNVGARRGTHVVQVYAARPVSVVDRPVRWLVGVRPVVLDPGARGVVEIDVPRRAFAHWADGWHLEPGAFVVAVAPHAGAAGVEAEVEPG